MRPCCSLAQGGAVALNAAYRHPTKLAGCVALSGWLTLKEDFTATSIGAAKETPCFWGHGSFDDKVLFPHQAIGVGVLKAASRVEFLMGRVDAVATTWMVRGRRTIHVVAAAPMRPTLKHRLPA